MLEHCRGKQDTDDKGSSATEDSATNVDATDEGAVENVATEEGENENEIEIKEAATTEEVEIEMKGEDAASK